MRDAPDWRLVRPSDDEARRMRRRAAMVLCAAAILLLANLPLFPIYPWDEARVAINAMEMRQSGLSLVTTYHFQPDLWNTKPPLLIWLMDASMALFGPHAWAVRLPSALATLGSIAIVMGLSWRATRSAFVAVTAGLLLLASRGYSGEHVGQTADYDALTCFFTTAYGAVLFLALSRARPKPGPVLLAGLLIAAAVLSKGVAGLVPGAGIAAYLILTGRWMRPLRSLWCWLAGVLVILVAGGFYLGREAAAPGYLKAVWANEVAGRYVGAIQGHRRWIGYYLVQAFAVAGFSLGPFALPLLWPLRRLHGRRRALARFALCIAATLFVVLSLGGTKIRWYIAPAYPFLAIACALALETVFADIRHKIEQSKGRAAAAGRMRALAAAGVGVLLIEFFAGCYLYPWGGEHRATGRYGAVFAGLHARGVTRVRVVDEGLWNSEGQAAYAPQADFYGLVWREKGLLSDRLPAAEPLRAKPGDVLASCDDRWTGRLAAMGRPLVHVPGCVAVKL